MVTNFPLIFIIILNWNGKHDTIKCLNSVKEINYPNYRIIVVDNGSTDDSVKYIEQKFPEIEVITNEKNLGYAEGNNKGILHALSKGAEYIFILNNDTVVDKNILTSFLDTGQNNPDAGIFGAKIYFHDEPSKIWFAGGKWLPNIGQFTHIGYGQTDDFTTWNSVRKIDYACGCALFFKAEVVKDIGLLESKYFLTWEETDFCYRARRAGFDCLYVPTALVWHKISASFKGGEMGLLHHYFMSRNRLLWVERNLSKKERINFYFRTIVPEIKSTLRVLLNLKSNNVSRVKCKVTLIAIKDYIIRRFGDCPDWIRTI